MLITLYVFCAVATASTTETTPAFEFRGRETFLDGERFQVLSGELHPSRISPEQWAHHIAMARAMGLNAITVGIFWGAHERREGEIDFKSPENDIKHFLALCEN